MPSAGPVLVPGGLHCGSRQGLQGRLHGELRERGVHGAERVHLQAGLPQGPHRARREQVCAIEWNQKKEKENPLKKLELILYFWRPALFSIFTPQSVTLNLGRKSGLEITCRNRNPA